MKNKTEDLLELWRGSGPGDQEINRGYSFELVEKIAGVFSAGSFYYYVFNFFDLEIDFVHPNVQQVLGVSPENFSIASYIESIHPQDLPPPR